MFVRGLRGGHCLDRGFLGCDTVSQHVTPKLLFPPIRLHGVTILKTTIRFPVIDGKELMTIVKKYVLL
jgi:hypothetical protein